LSVPLFSLSYLSLTFTPSCSTYDEYKSELATGHLTWSPPHKNDDFWRDNAVKLTDRDREQLKILVQLLISSTEPLTLAVAANDIAQFVKYHDNGKKCVSFSFLYFTTNANLRSSLPGLSRISAPRAV
jgi:hypothetical protein